VLKTFLVGVPVKRIQNQSLMTHGSAFIYSSTPGFGMELKQPEKKKPVQNFLINVITF